ncbi:MAG: metallophosphoesterase [Bacteroidaceae bacterium]|nr:metallophosphoesterase [Bacteroidaceae bacterium]
MKTILIIVLVSMLVGVAYVSWHLWRITPCGGIAKLAVVALFLLWMTSAFVCLFASERFSVPVATVLYEVSYTWLIAFLYLLIIFAVADVVKSLTPVSLPLDGSGKALLAIVGTIATILIAGNVHYRHKYREELTIRTSKPIEKPLTIVFASDLHIGYHNRRAELASWINLFNAEQPDLVLIGGDIIDRSIRPLLVGEYAKEFHRLNAPILSVLGNHEYISGVRGAEQFFADANIRLLKDESLDTLGIRVIGRNDRSNRHRKPLVELTDRTSVFTVLLDHQPFDLQEAEEAGIDFQFSGHTHRGQVWPISWITDAIYEKSWGHHQRGATRYYISSGLGIWGPKIRIGTRSEYLILHIVPQ